ncbi:hypothetical protein XELAEV_18020719mg [Xenopus laevis]|uniref:Uncharacterized protein n=1 Tax=Xenopus laevis TaxID=8355 RepID=A0A974D9U3_XENLA|nr:hypothetical protein XELAEV_18020719mg [Xenopus laevis]
MTGINRKSEPITETRRNVHKNILSSTCATYFQSSTTCERETNRH